MQHRDDMVLGSLVRVLVNIPGEGISLLIDLTRKLTGRHHEAWLRELKLFLSKQPTWVAHALVKATKSAEAIINVDRDDEPVTPPDLVSFHHPELQQTGPTQYLLGDIDLGMPSGFEDESRLAHRMLECSEVSIGSCLNLADGLAIQSTIDPSLFQSTFGKDTYLWLWKSSATDDKGRDVVPCLMYCNDEVYLQWMYLSNSPTVGHLMPGYHRTVPRIKRK